MSESTELMTAGLAQIGYELSDVREFLVTHLHRDHYTQAVVLRRETGAHVALGEGERPTFEVMHDESRLPMSGMASYTPGMEITGGSLGPGLGIAVGMCLGLKR